MSNCPGLHCPGCGNAGPAGLVAAVGAVSGVVAFILDTIWYFVGGTLAALVLVGVPMTVKTYRALRMDEPTWTPALARVRPRVNDPAQPARPELPAPSPGVYRQLTELGQAIAAIRQGDLDRDGERR